MNNDSTSVLPTSTDSCPISTLLNKRVKDMSDSELEAYAKELRDLQRDDEALSQKLGGKKTKAKASAVAKAKITLETLGI